MKLEKPSERIKDIARGYVSDYPEAIMIFLDEQYEKEETPEKNPACGVTDQMLGNDKHEFEEECKNAECRARKAIMLKELPGIEEVISATNWSDNMLIKGKSIKESVSERNALIDELVQEVDKLIGNLNFKDMVINVLKSKKK